ncbi:ricin-type beta-trefoil lectin domain protein [Micromonospora sp. S4605]|uniref:ricin-type beta-trefoil lectin domain protein n=1 Tax=Micromonospora sp. S4605 TaxID=1420897 RepID=UPI00237D1F27|nr:ricin-type beta-trefoil lectin domain protein [Micromonospora sp. S4605]
MVAVVLALTASLLTHVPASAKPKPTPSDQSQKPVPTRKVKQQKPTRRATDGPGRSRLTHTTLPPAAVAAVPVSGRVTKVGELPVTVSPPAVTSLKDEQRAMRGLERQPTSVRVRVLEEKAAKAAGVAGSLLALSRIDGADRPGRVQLRVDYQNFANAYGGDFSGRLRLVALPACALTTPEDPKCRTRRDLKAVRSGSTLSAQVRVEASGLTSVVALASTPSSAGGTFAETNRSQAYSWSAGNQSGSFNYGYKLTLPPAGVGPQPSLAFTYDSGRVDGQTSTQNGQSSWIGDGWDLQVGYIERSYRPCVQDGSTAYVGDLCQFSPYNATMVFGGKASELVFDGTKWRAAGDDGMRIEKLDRTSWPYAVNNGDDDDEFWRVTAQDGVQYFFGVSKRNSNDNESTKSVQTVPVFGNNPGEPCYPSVCHQAYRWNLDFVVDPHGNSMTYGYTKLQNFYSSSGSGRTFAYDLNAHLNYVDYGDRGQEHAQQAPMRVEFETRERCVAEPCVDQLSGLPDRAKYLDTPWDLYCASEVGCTNSSPSFLTTKRLYAVRAMVLDAGNPPQYRVVDEWKVEHDFPATGDYIDPPGDDTSPHLWLKSIEHTGRGVDGATIVEPKIEFGGDPYDNRVDWGTDIGVPPYRHYRLTSVQTGTGGETLVNYMGGGCSRATPPTPERNPDRCFPQRHYSDGSAGFGWFHKYVVSSVTDRDLTGGSPEEITSYAYTNEASSDEALWAHDGNETVQLAYRSWSQWRGYSTVTATKSGGGGETKNRNVYYRGMDGDALTDVVGQKTAWYGRDAGLLAPLGTPGVDGAVSGDGKWCARVGSPGFPPANGSSITVNWCPANYPGLNWQRQPDGAIKNGYGGCLDVGGTADGSPIRYWTCTGASNQKWVPHLKGAFINPQSGKCLDIPNYGTGALQLSTCTGEWDQAFQLNRRLAVSHANRCIDLANSETANGTVVQSRTCNNLPNQLWQLQSNGSLKNPASNRCLDIQGAGTVDGTKIMLYDCTGNANQIWEPQANGSLKNPQTGKCLDAGSGQSTRADYQLVIWTCNSGSILQKWLNRFNDSDGLNGFLRESLDFDGNHILASTIHVPTVTQTATRIPPVNDGKDVRAHRVKETMTKARTWIGAAGTWRWTESRASYDSAYGMPTETRDLGDTAVTTDDTCTRTEYAFNTTKYLIAYPKQTTEYAGACGSTTILSQNRTYYDHSLDLNTPPTIGRRTKHQVLTTAPDTWATTEATYDPRGRPLTNKDARGHTTTTSYNPADNLPLKDVTVQNPLGHVAKVTFETGRAQPTQVLDANGRTTLTEYDPLGRRSAVYLPTEKKENGDPPSVKYAYDIRADAPSKLTVQTLQDRPTSTSPAVYVTSYQFLDGRLRERNTQRTAPGGTGRIITATSYDGRGQVAAQTAPYYNTEPAGTALDNPSPATLASRTTYSYDSLGRVTAEALEANGVETWRTRHSYDGDRHTLMPPSGGNSTTYHDAAGQATKVAVRPGTAVEETRYSYNAAGELTTITDAAGNVTRYGYDLSGNRTSVQDPNTGSSSSKYNPIGDLEWTIDARGQKISYRYDTVGRVTERWAGELNTGTKLAAYTYDGLAFAKGQLSSTIRYVAGAEYKVEPTGYDDRYRPTGTRWTIPPAEGKLAGTYTTGYGYDSADHLTSVTYSAKGGLTAETVTAAYDTNGYPTTLAGASNYVTDTDYTPIGQLAMRTYGDPGAGQLKRSYGWEPATGRLSNIVATLPDPALPDTPKTIQNDQYTYLPAGDVSAIKDLTDGQSQCFTYDGLHRLTEAYTALDDCAANPTNVSATGKQPYWDSYTFDTAGRRATDTHRTGTAQTTRTYTYPAVGQPRVHAMTSVAVTGSTTRTDTYGYHPDGSMRTRTVAGITTNYTINPEGRFDTATVGGTEHTKHIYDADGAPLIRTDPTGATLYLGGEELRLANNTVTGTRYYTHTGSTVAVRKAGSTTVTWLAADHQNSATLTVDPITGAVQRRWYTPYGADRSQVSNWPTDRGFLNAPANPSTKLLDVGAREYDPDTGTFTAPDPLVAPGNPNSLNPYAYAHHNPITLSDPTGLAPGIELSDNQKAVATVAVLSIAAIAVCVGTAGIGCAVMTGAAIGAGLGATFAEDGKRFQGALIGGLAGAAGAAAGAGAGALLVRTVGLAANSKRMVAISNVAAGMTESAANQSIATGTVDWRQVILEGALGGALGLAGRAAAKAIGKAKAKAGPGCTVATHSFAPATLVLMADGSNKPIGEIENGDHVLATDPETGQTEAKPVEQLHSNHDTDLTDLTVRIEDTTPADGTDDSTTTVLYTTQHHPFWDQTNQQWVYAANLTVGHQLRTTDGDTVTVTAVRNHTSAQNMRDLTIADIHTYYVIAGNTPVLVHNVNLPIVCGPVTNKTHFAQVLVRDADGNELHRYALRSGATTPEEAALGKGRARQAVHTEHRASRAAGGAPMVGDRVIHNDPFWGVAPVPEGGLVSIAGIEPPCGPCQGQMKRSAEDTGATFEYHWPDGAGGINTWSSDD